MSPARATESASGYRRYRWKGRELVSVTSALSGGIPKPALVPWAAKMVAQWTVDNFAQVTDLVAKDPDDAVQLLKGAHWKAKKAAGLKGTEIHELAEAISTGQPLPPVSPGAVPYVGALREFLRDFNPQPIMVEESVYSPTHGYAGTLDAIAKFDDPVLGTRILDYKTARGVYGETALQLAALYHADGTDNGDGTLKPLPPVDGGLVVHIAPTGYALYLADISDETFEFFLAAMKIANFTNDVSKTVLQAI